MKTLEQKLEHTRNYVSKSAQHLFVVNDNTILKVIPFIQNDTTLVARLMITGDKVELKVRTYNAAMKWDMKDYFFPKYVKTKSIPYFKKMRELVEMIESEVNALNNDALIEKIKLRVKDLELIK
jgi:hypothetical protein